MRKTMNEIRKSIVIRQLNDALNIRNDSSSILIHNLSLNFDVLVYRKKKDNQSKSWKDSFKLLNVDDESTIMKLSSDSTKFRSTMIKSYYDNNHFENSSLFTLIIDFSFIAFISKSLNMFQSNDQFVASIDQKSKFEIFSNSFKRDRDRFRNYFASIAYLSFVFNTIDDLDLAFAFVFASTSILVLVVASKLDLIVHIVLFQFATFRQNEINDLIEKKCFSINKQERRIIWCLHIQLSIRRRD
jgi:hypothetical protein